MRHLQGNKLIKQITKNYKQFQNKKIMETLNELFNEVNKIEKSIEKIDAKRKTLVEQMNNLYDEIF